MEKPKLIILSGSPKQMDESVTMYYLYFLEELFKNVSFVTFSLWQCLDSKQIYEKLLEELENADAVLWATPVYVYSIPSHLIEFVEMVQQEKKDIAKFAGKYASTITTSIKCYDHIAHRYIERISKDWGMGYLKGYSAERNSLTEKETQINLTKFFRLFLDLTKSRVQKIKSQLRATKKILLINDGSDIASFKDIVHGEIETFSVQNDMPEHPECMGCVHCLITGECNKGTDLKIKILVPFIKAEFIIIAIDFKQTGFSWKFKALLDRLLWAGHYPYLENAPTIGILATGNHEMYLEFKDSLIGYFEQKGAGFIDIIFYDLKDERVLLKIREFLEVVVSVSNMGIKYQKTFLGKGATLVSEMFMNQMFGPLPKDFKYYLKHGFEIRSGGFGTWLKNVLIAIAMVFSPVVNIIKKKSKSIIAGPVKKFLIKFKKKSSKRGLSKKLRTIAQGADSVSL